MASANIKLWQIARVQFAKLIFNSAGILKSIIGILGQTEYISTKFPVETFFFKLSYMNITWSLRKHENMNIHTPPPPQFAL